MKLRLRSLESKETAKLDVPDDCTLRLLKQSLIARSVPSSSSSSSSSPPSPSSVHLSLNRRDEIFPSFPGGDSLQSLGITSGDLIYFSLNPNAFSPPVQQQQQQQQVIPTVPSGSSAEELPHPMASEGGSTISGDSDYMARNSSVDGQIMGHQSVDSEMKDVGGEGEGKEQSQVSDANDYTELPDAESDAEGLELDVYKHSVPYFLRRVSREGLGNEGVEHRLVVIAVHAVMLESGFVGFDAVTRTRVDGFSFNLPDKWPSAAVTISLSYTLPELLADGSNEVERVVLKFQSMCHYLTVYGSLAYGKAGLHRICLDKYRFARRIDLMWANCDQMDVASFGDSSTSSYPDNEVFEFWKVVKDGLALPLLIDLSQRANLPLPSCLMCLPSELKLQILELLDGVDLARMALVSSEFSYLASRNDVWKQKFLKEFGDPKEVQDGVTWKRLYVTYMKRKRIKNRLSRMSRQVERPGFHHWPPFMWRDPDPLRVPRTVGGDHDWIPGGLGPPFGRLGAFPRFHIRRNVGPNCNLGGLDG